jgi:hypothetical protein
VRYSWFVNLEKPLSHERFADPDHMRRWRFLVDPAPTPANPDQLPIGFTRHFDPGIGEDVLDITCAACHTGEIHYTQSGKTRAIRIDGGPAMHAFTDMKRGNFAPMLAASLLGTAINPWKFDRFAQRVLGPGVPRANQAQEGAVRHSQGNGCERPEPPLQGTLPGARGLWPHGCAGSNRQYRIRRSPLCV